MEPIRKIAKSVGGSAYIALPKELVGKELIITEATDTELIKVNQKLTAEEIEDIVTRVIRKELEKVRS